MKQVNNKNKSKSVKRKVATKGKAARRRPLYGTSKLEDYFAENFLDKLDVRYVRQFEAKDIKRFYDFAVLLGDGNISSSGNLVLIEIDGGYW